LLTAKTHEAEKILGLDVGADDCVTKPFSPRELRARIRAMMRRSSSGQGDEVPGDIHRFGPFELNMARFELRREGRSVDATTTDIKLLAAFVSSRGGC
jgi:DNA-binding response OmpR family regulator